VITPRLQVQRRREIAGKPTFRVIDGMSTRSSAANVWRIP
jgi:hypothetical protein